MHTQSPLPFLLLLAPGLLSACSAGDAATADGLAAWNAGATQANAPNGGQAGANTNVGLGGSQDFGFYRQQVMAGQIPSPESLDAAGFFAEHHSQLPPPACGQRICVQPMVAVMGNLLDGSNCTMLHLGLNSPVAADPSERPPLSLSVVVDVSGSMGGEKLAFVQQGLELLVDGMRDADELALVTYSDTAHVVAALGPVQDRRVELRDVVRNLVATGATNLSDGLLEGYQELFTHYDSSRQNRVILLSDGVPTAGIQDTSTILDLSRGYNSDGVGLTTIGLGTDFNAALMRDLALQADGNFYFLEDAGAVNEVFAEELSFFTVPLAFDLELNVQAGDDYQFGRALGTPFWQDTDGGGKLEVPSVFLAHRESDKDVTEDNGRRGGGSALLVELMPMSSETGDGETTIATVDLKFREPGTNAMLEDRVQITYPYAAGELQRRGYFDADSVPTVQKSFVMLNIYVGMERVSQAFYANEANEDTVFMLDNLIAAAEDYNDEVQDTDIALDLEMLHQLRENLQANGIGVFEPVVIENAWPAD